MNKINILFADDMKSMHEGLKILVEEVNKTSNVFKLNIVKEFYNTSDLKRFLNKNSSLGIDILFLDIEFKGGESGIDALEKIREFAPGIEITLLSAYEKPDWVLPAQNNYGVKHLTKPITSDKLIIHINELKVTKENSEKMINKMKEVMNEDSKFYEDWIKRIEKDTKAEIPKNFESIINKMFGHITFTSQALKELLSCIDYNVYNVLKYIDLNLPSTNGMYEKTIKKEKIGNYYEIKEYRFSQKGRIFVSYQDIKPIVVCIDPNHRVCK